MKIKWQGFIGQNHSWSICAQNISRALLAKQHDVDLISTNGVDLIPPDLLPHIKEKPEPIYDVQLTYTALKNFPNYLSSGKRNRFGIWNYETTVLPAGFAKFHQACDLLLPSSEFSKQIFKDNGIPEEKMVVVPHGIDIGDSTAEPYRLKTKKSIKICVNIAQLHVRKNMTGLLEAYGKAFTDKDDVCLVLKVVDKKPKLEFEESFQKIYQNFNQKYKNRAEIEIINTFIPNIYSLYNACDIVWSMTMCECFYMPALEGAATGTIVVAPRYGGQLDFLNDSNSLLIEGDVVPAERRMQYWSSSPYAKAFRPNIDDGVDKIRYAVNNVQMLKAKFNPVNKEMIKNYTWDKVVDKIISLTT